MFNSKLPGALKSSISWKIRTFSIPQAVFFVVKCGSISRKHATKSRLIFWEYTTKYALHRNTYKYCVARSQFYTPFDNILKVLMTEIACFFSLLWWCWSRILLEIKASEQRHRLFSLAWLPLHHIRPGPEFMRLRPTQIQIQNVCYYLNNDQGILSQFYHK